MVQIYSCDRGEVIHRTTTNVNAELYYLIKAIASWPSMRRMTLICPI